MLELQLFNLKYEKNNSQLQRATVKIKMEYCIQALKKGEFPQSYLLLMGDLVCYLIKKMFSLDVVKASLRLC